MSGEDKPKYRVRFRQRIQASRQVGLRASWGEYQVLEGRKVVSRHDLETQALDWIQGQGDS